MWPAGPGAAPGWALRRHALTGCTFGLSAHTDLPSPRPHGQHGAQQVVGPRMADTETQPPGKRVKPIKSE